MADQSKAKVARRTKHAVVDTESDFPRESVERGRFGNICTQCAAPLHDFSDDNDIAPRIEIVHFEIDTAAGRPMIELRPWFKLGNGKFERCETVWLFDPRRVKDFAMLLKAFRKDLAATWELGPKVEWDNPLNVDTTRREYEPLVSEG